MLRFTTAPTDPVADPRIQAMAQAIRARRVVRLRFASAAELTIHPVGLTIDGDSCAVRDGLGGSSIPIPEWGRVNLSARRFAPT